MSADALCNINMDAVLMEIHNLAYHYHWGREECWNAPCHEREVFNDYIMRQLKAEARAARGTNH